MPIGKESYEKLLDSLYDGVYYVDRERRITCWNRGAEELTGYGSSEVVGRSGWDNILMHIDDKGVNLCQERCPLKRTLSDGQPRELESYVQHKDGHRIPVLLRVAAIRDDQRKIIGAAAVLCDNSPKAAILQRLEDLQKMALYDPLTNLGSKGYAEMSLRSRIEEMQRYGWIFGALFIDLDHFRRINELHGHDVGDKVLQMVGKTLLNNMRSSDILGRWGGEEFLAIILNVNKHQLYSVANRLRLLVKNSGFRIGPDIIQVTVSVGATLAQPKDTPETFIKRVDELMHQSKSSGRDRASMSPKV